MADPARREAIMAAIVAALDAALPGVSVDRNRRDDPQPEECPTLIVFDAPHDAAGTNQGLTNYRMQVGIDGAVTAATDSAIGTAMNALYADTLRALLVDWTLGGVATQLQETAFTPRLVTAAQGQVPMAFFSLDVAVDFMTPDGDPSGIG